MIKSPLFFALLAYTILFTFSCKVHQIELKQTNVNDNFLIGTWYMQKVHWKTQDTTYSIDNAQRGMFIFSDSTYSLMWTPIDRPRKPFEKLSNPTEKEMISGFKSIVFNAGKYIHTDSTVEATAYIAKVPGFEGGKQFYRYIIKNNRLTITMYDETYPNETKPSWSGKYVTIFILSKESDIYKNGAIETNESGSNIEIDTDLKVNNWN